MPQSLVTPASETESKEVDWLWKPYIPRAFVTVSAGPKWAGKTWAHLAIATGLANGYGLPDGDTQDPLNIGWISSEDPIEYVLRPRLDSLGADLSRFFLRYGALGLDTGIIKRIEQTIKDRDLDLLVLDPLMSFLPSGKRSISSEDMRAVLDPLGEIAYKHHMGVLVITHISKQPYGEALDRISGSGQITAQARSVLLADKDPDKPTEERARILVHAGTNLARPGKAWPYTLPDETIGEGFEWGEESSDISADRLFGLDKEDVSDDLKGASATAAKFLRAECSKDWSAAEDIKVKAEQMGISKRTIERIAGKYCNRRRAGVGTTKQRVYWRWADSDNTDESAPNNVVPITSSNS